VLVGWIHPGDQLLGFFWVTTPDYDLAMVTTNGMELFQLLPEHNGLRAVDHRKHQVKPIRAPMLSKSGLRLKSRKVLKNHFLIDLRQDSEYPRAN
jgi:hypothetical protein